MESDNFKPMNAFFYSPDKNKDLFDCLNGLDIFENVSLTQSLETIKNSLSTSKPYLGHF